MDQNPFKQAQVRHRRQADNPNRVDDKEDWVDFGHQTAGNERIFRVEIPSEASNDASYYKGPLFGLLGFPGFLFAPQALDMELQEELAYESVTQYCEVPHRTNIDLCKPKTNEEENLTESMWQNWKTENEPKESIEKKQKLASSKIKKYRSFKKLSWATMGYHYDWTERSYNVKKKSVIPSLIHDLSMIFARTSLMAERNDEPDKKLDLSFSPSAAIVNYYNTKSNMGGHRDDLEFAIEKPLISVSLGLPAIFLLGGDTKGDKLVVPILVRPGDVMLMGGPSRLKYHAMARLIPRLNLISEAEKACCPKHTEKISLASFGRNPNTREEDLVALEIFLSQHRINLNIRQVYKNENDCGVK